MHGLAMQPYSPEFAKKNLTSQSSAITIGEEAYRADIEKGIVTATSRNGEVQYKIEHVMGGKNVYYFLTPFPKGRLQTLPVAYDVAKQEWFDTAGSGRRHFPSGQQSQVVNWREYSYTFNTACYNCHVSQLSTNYHPESDTYQTTWIEPGINCETCHGPASEHIKIAKATAEGQPLPELGIISTKTMTTTQRNDLCVSCHAKANPLAAEYQPKERFYDFFDLVTLEDADFYPDGRDLGENYTFSSWSMSPCVKSGQIDCMHCHTSSGRYRFKQEKFNDACLPCHAEKVSDPAAHTHHPQNSEASKCISCHMPKTSFARMQRSDHSMLPPAPAATMAFNSPNACNSCHTDKEASWADALVRQWRARDYQAPLLERATLIDMARKGNWTKLPEMLAYITDPQRDEIFATSLIRLIPPALKQEVGKTLRMAAQDPSPLVRGAAVLSLGAIGPSAENLQVLVAATGDDFRLVRIRAAAGLAAFPGMIAPPSYASQVGKATDEYLTSMTTRPDQWTSHYNLGNYLLGQGENGKAMAAYRKALQRDPRAIMVMVNMSIAHARMGETDAAEKALSHALAQEPENAAANFNMGLLQAGNGDLAAAEKYLRKAVAAEPKMAQAAHSLCLITAKERINEAVTWCRKAFELRPEDAKFGYSLAFYLNQKGDKDEAVKVLDLVLARHPHQKQAESLLKEISR